MLYEVITGVSKRFLLAERRRAFEGKITDDCRYHSCRLCGACDLENGRPAENGVRPRTVLAERDQLAPEAQARITSYNVCYTKLLRITSTADPELERVARIRTTMPPRRNPCSEPGRGTNGRGFSSSSSYNFV